MLLLLPAHVSTCTNVARELETERANSQCLPRMHMNSQMHLYVERRGHWVLSREILDDVYPMCYVKLYVICHLSYRAEDEEEHGERKED